MYNELRVYIYIYVCVCVCMWYITMYNVNVCFSEWDNNLKNGIIFLDMCGFVGILYYIMSILYVCVYVWYYSL